MKVSLTRFFIDSLVLSLSAELDEIVRPNMQENWTREKPQWFVLDDSIDQKREPGKIFFLFYFNHQSFTFRFIENRVFHE